MRQIRLLNLEHLIVLLAGAISQTRIQCMDFVEFFNVSLDLSAIYFSCCSFLECYNRFSEIKLSIR